MEFIGGGVPMNSRDEEVTLLILVNEARRLELEKREEAAAVDEDREGLVQEMNRKWGAVRREVKEMLLEYGDMKKARAHLAARYPFLGILEAHDIESSRQERLRMVQQLNGYDDSSAVDTSDDDQNCWSDDADQEDITDPMFSFTSTAPSFTFLPDAMCSSADSMDTIYYQQPAPSTLTLPSEDAFAFLADHSPHLAASDPPPRDPIPPRSLFSSIAAPPEPALPALPPCHMLPSLELVEQLLLVSSSDDPALPGPAEAGPSPPPLDPFSFGHGPFDLSDWNSCGSSTKGFSLAAGAAGSPQAGLLLPSSTSTGDDNSYDDGSSCGSFDENSLSSSFSPSELLSQKERPSSQQTCAAAPDLSKLLSNLWTPSGALFS
ncbi:hypothetical protein DIPPA_01953 [Diplonema papillatum]|nr:hypothetical protein DIPPA_01953 [Diplonema papillatum]